MTELSQLDYKTLNWNSTAVCFLTWDYAQYSRWHYWCILTDDTTCAVLSPMLKNMLYTTNQSVT